jgi:hypothetical protein
VLGPSPAGQQVVLDLVELFLDMSCDDRIYCRVAPDRLWERRRQDRTGATIPKDI